ncbi:MAG: GNAT family N-acetyltransferase [Syntrophomonadaceae bacterium]|jgi:lipid II:glycine glycyltransferase (peptidoglycan interpeptide bridge formation enzyme)
MTNKEKYRKLIKSQPSIPIFSRDWWMEAVCGEENWDVLLVEKNNEIIASQPYYIHKKYGLKVIRQPILTQTNGIWIKYPPLQAAIKRLSYEKKVMNDIIDQLLSMEIDWFSQNFHYSITNWLPFYWRGFQQTTRYTYLISDINTIDLDDLPSRFSKSAQSSIRRAEPIVEVKTGLSAQEFYRYHKMVLEKKDAEIIYSFETFDRIYNATVRRGFGQTMYTIDQDGVIHSALFVIWDENSAYLLISALDPDLKDTGSMSLLRREAIKYVSTRTIHFDFEGSMIEGVENSYRQFASVPKPYFNISFMSRRMRVAYHGKELINSILNRQTNTYI